MAETADFSTCTGPYGEPIPLVHFDNCHGVGKLAVSVTDTQALFTTPRTPFDTDINPVMIGPEDRRVLAKLLLKGLPETS